MKHYLWKNIKGDIVEAYDMDVQRRTKAKKQQWKKRERKTFLSYLYNEKKKYLLEIGAGTGEDSVYLKKCGLNVTTIDISPANVRQCKKRGLKALILDMYDLHKLHRKFDAIYALNSLQHIPKNDFEFILRKIKKTLKKGGLFYLGLYGGIDCEGIYKKDHCRPKRFFSFYHTEGILAIVQKYYCLEYFRHIMPFKDGGTHQSIILRRK